MKISLKIKLMSAFFIIISVPMWILGIVSYKMASNSIQGSIEQQLRDQTSDASLLIGETINSVEKSIEISSMNQDIINAVNTKNEDDVNIALEYMKKVQKSNKDSMEVLIITDEYGKVIVDTQTKEEIDLSDREYMKEALSTGKLAVSEVLTSRFTGNKAIFIVQPIMSNNKIIGTLVGSINFNKISQFASRIKIGDSGYAYMIDKNGLIISHPDESKVLKENASDKANDEFKAIIEDMKKGNSGESFYTYNNVYKYVSYKPAGSWVIAVNANYDDYMKSALEIKKDTIIIVIISNIIAMICAYLFSVKGIINPIKKLEELMRKAGDGDLSVKINLKNKDEIGELGNSFNNMINHQHEIVKNVREASEQLNAVSEEMAASSEEISATTEEITATIVTVAQDAEKQNDAIIEVSKVLVELSSLVQLAQNRADVTSINAKNTMQVADFGRKKVNETVKAINIIDEGTDETAKALEQLNSLSVQVGGITDTINAIAEQTNLLALNAAIEAARAGEHGKGFSVVAEEVRTLSEESNGRAQEITALVNEMVKQTQNAVEAMKSAKLEVDNGVKIVSETDEAFVNIINAIKDITDHVTEILDITGDEVASSDKVVKLINDIATVTESNTSNCENVSLASTEQSNSVNNLTATAEETSAMSEELTKLVEKFIV